MVFGRVTDRIADWMAKRALRKFRESRKPTASCDVPGLGRFDLIQGAWEGAIEVPGFSLSATIDTEGASIPEDTIPLLRSIVDSLAELHQAAQTYCDSLEGEVDREWIEACGGLRLFAVNIVLDDDQNDFELCHTGIGWEDAMVDVAFRDMEPVGHFFSD